MKYGSIACLIFITFLSCQNLAVEKHIIGKYYITATDTEEQQELSYAIGNGTYISLVPSYVYSIAYNSKYIVVKQHPHIDAEQIINYYVLERQNEETSQLETIPKTPLTEDIFNTNKAKFEAFGELIFKDL